MKNFGLKFDVITPDNYILGQGQVESLVPPLQPDLDWTPFLPIEEKQHDLEFDTSNCTAFGTLNSLEILFNKLNEQKNFSDRWLGIQAGTRPPGNSPHVVCEALRKEGTIPEPLLPFDFDLLETIDDYYSFKGADQAQCEVEAGKFLNQYEFYHDWVLTGGETEQQRVENIRKALAYSPLGASVSAWFPQGDVYVDNGQVNNHWVTIVKDNPSKKTFTIYDSYSPHLKEIPYSHTITLCKRFVIKQRIVKDNWLVALWKSLLRFLGIK